MIAAAFFLIILAGSALAQDGRWVEFDLSTIGSTQLGSGAGDDGIAGFAPNNSKYILIFDVEVGEWLTIDLDEAQEFAFFETEDNVLFGYTDNLILGYSGLTQTWDTVYYSGTVLAVGYNQSFGLKGNLAFFVTDNMFYVFDAEVGAWVSYTLSFPADFSGGQFRIGNNYIAMYLSSSISGTAPKNVVYSGVVKAFNELEEGCQVPTPPMKDGYASAFNPDGMGDMYRMVGYSALTNTFDVFTYDATEEATVSYSVSWNEESRTVFSCGFYTVVPYVSVTIRYYGFDTNLGSWTETVYVHDLDVEYPNRYIHIGGRGAMDNSNFDDGTYHWFYYNGFDGSFTETPSSLVYKSTTSGWNCGGSVFCAFDTLNAYGYDFLTGADSHISLEFDKTSSFKLGENYASLTRWNDESDMMRIYFYNSDNNLWSSVEVPDDHSGSSKTTPYGYIRRIAGENIIVYYSSYNDNIVTLDLDDGIMCYVYIEDRLACARSDNGSVMIDDTRQTTHTFDFNLNPSGMGSNSALFYDDAAKTMYGYSLISGLITEHSYTETPYICNNTGYIGLLTVYHNGNGYNKLYTYNGFADSWIELIPSGSHSLLMVGKKTILVSRSGSPDMLYAFDPQRSTTDVGDELTDDGILPAQFELAQNYPNPFNPETIIKYSVPYRSDVRIDIYNILGRKVTTLVDEVKAAGEYDAVWNGTNGAGARAASGVYFYRLKAGDKAMVRKMLLMK